MSEGVKHDHGKPRWDLMPFGALEEIVKVFTYGSVKYDDYGWQKVVAEAGGQERYFSALMRHIAKVQSGELIDEESGLLHMAQVGANVLILLWHTLRQEVSE